MFENCTFDRACFILRPYRLEYIREEDDSEERTKNTGDCGYKCSEDETNSREVNRKFTL